MEVNKSILVEVVYAALDSQRMLSVEVEQGSTIETAIHLSGILTHFPEIDLTKQAVGVFGKLHHLQDVLNAGDRIEIYRPLTIDPKEARRAKARKKEKVIV